MDVESCAPCHSDDERLGGYGGLWTFFRGDSGEIEQVDNEFRAYRCFAIAGGLFPFLGINDVAPGFRAGQPVLFKIHSNFRLHVGVERL